LTNRDAQAKDFIHLLSLESPRPDAPTSLPEPADSGFSCEDDTENGGSVGRVAQDLQTTSKPIEPTLGAFLQVALMRDYHTRPAPGRGVALRRFRQIRDRQGALRYMQEVDARMKVRRRIPNSKRKARSGVSADIRG
jgi:phospholipase C